MPRLVIELKSGEVIDLFCETEKVGYRAIALAAVYHHIPLSDRDIGIDKVKDMRVEKEE